MFVAIVCTNCQAPSQIDERALGQVVQCPHCGKSTVTRKQETVLPVAKPLQEKLLTLDDEPVESPPRRKRSPVKTAVYATLSLAITLALMAGIYFAFRYGKGEIPDGAWKTFAPPLGHCTILLPGEPVQEDLPAERFATIGGKRFVVNRWLEQMRFVFGWYDLDTQRLQGVQFDQIAVPFRDGELNRLHGKLESTSTVNFVVGKRKFEAMRFQMEADGNKIITQVYMEANAEPRKLYFAAVGGKKVPPDAASVQKFFNSLVPE